MYNTADLPRSDYLDHKIPHKGLGLPHYIQHLQAESSQAESDKWKAISDKVKHWDERGRWWFIGRVFVATNSWINYMIASLADSHHIFQSYLRTSTIPDFGAVVPSRPPSQSERSIFFELGIFCSEVIGMLHVFKAIVYFFPSLVITFPACKNENFLISVTIDASFHAHSLSMSVAELSISIQKPLLWPGVRVARPQQNLHSIYNCGIILEVGT